MSELICRANNCPLAETGECLEGISPISDCPNVNESESETSQSTPHVSVEPAASAPEPAYNLLPNGEQLSGKELADLMHKLPCTLVVIVGDIESGKTTLLVELYNAFQEGTFADFTFAGSGTLLAFERRSYLSRLVSEQDKADTERTRRASSLPFLHLRLNKNRNYDLLFSDLSGEVFSDIADSLEAARNQGEIKRADHLVAMLDGEILANPASRQAHVSKMSDVLQSLVQEQVLQPPTRVHLVTSKWDYLASDQEAAGWVTSAMNSLERHLGKFLVEKHRIAARSTHSDVERGFHLDHLLGQLAQRKDVKGRLSTTALAPKRAFLQYTLPTTKELS